MVLLPDYANRVGEAVTERGELDRARVDGDERIFGRIAQRGAIAAVLDGDTGQVLIQTGAASEVAARITDYRYPIPQVGDDVLLTYTIDGDAIATPTEPALPGTFDAVVLIGKGDANPANPHSGVVQHKYPDVRPSGVGERSVIAIGGAGVTMQAGDLVVCNITYAARVAAGAFVAHTIYAVSNIPVASA